MTDRRIDKRTYASDYIGPSSVNELNIGFIEGAQFFDRTLSWISSEFLIPLRYFELIMLD